MTSEITDFDKHSSIVSSNSQKKTTISGTSKIALVAFVVTGVAGIVIIALAQVHRPFPQNHSKISFNVIVSSLLLMFIFSKCQCSV